MGTRVAPSLANIHMGKFKDDHVYTYHWQPLIYLQYLDDIFLVWQQLQNGVHEIHYAGLHRRNFLQGYNCQTNR